MLEYLTNIYVLPLIATIIGISIVYLYDKFEKKQYTSAIYLRIALLIYISSFGTIYFSRLDFVSNSGIASTIFQSGGAGSSSPVDVQSMMPQANDLKIHLEQFKTGVPTF
uniref:Uncharacterized protein n=1 Tax=viral metagenome TaxID=1070528 RepID=A0A6C0F0D6_9ZZZZ